jgi:hypothetical protein
MRPIVTFTTGRSGTDAARGEELGAAARGIKPWREVSSSGRSTKEALSPTVSLSSGD